MHYINLHFRLILACSLIILFSCEEPDTTAPSVSVAYPAHGSSVSEIVNVTCVASDNVGIEKVELWIDGVSSDEIDETEPYSMTWNTIAYSDGSQHVITVRAYDGEDNTTDSDPVTVTVDNTSAYPQALEISSIVYEDGGFTISWPQSTDTDFSTYTLEKSLQSDFSETTILHVENNIANTSYTDPDVDPLIYQYYRIVVTDDLGLMQEGGIVASALDPIPSEIEILSISTIESGVQITWEECTDGDFLSYKILYSIDNNSLKDTLATYSDKATTSHVMTEYSNTVEYSFWIEVSDTLGQTRLGSRNRHNVQTTFQILTNYMLENDMDITSVMSNWITTAANVYGNELDYFIIDIRSADNFAQGHILGAINCSYADVVTTIEAQNTSNLPVLVVGYSGMSEAYILVAIRLSGYSDAKILKWGMASWHAMFDVWTGNVGDMAVGHANWVTTAAPATPSGYSNPVILSDFSDGAAILAERVESLQEEGFRGVPTIYPLDSPANYQVISYWGMADYEMYGHIDGAYQVTPGTLSITENSLNLLDPSMTITPFCWTGQTTSLLSAWLNVLGYDARVIKFGANGMIYSELMSHKWMPLTSSYPIVEE